MFPKNRIRLLLETLEDRFMPSVTYTLDGSGNLSITGSTSSAVFKITSTAASVTVMDGLSTRSFVVSGNLTLNLQLTAAAPILVYSPGAATLGAVSLTTNSIGNETVAVFSPAAAQNINGLLTVNTKGIGNDSVNIYNVKPAGLSINNGGGSDTVTVGYTNPLTPPPAAAGGTNTGPVTIRGNLQAQNVNLIGLGAPFGGAQPPVVVQGLASISTHIGNPALVTVANPNNIDVEGPGVAGGTPVTTIQGNLYATLNGPNEAFTDGGAVNGSVIVQLGAGTDLASISDPSIVGGNVNYFAAAGASTTGDINGIVGGNIGVVLGNGGNTFATHMTMGGTSFTYYGGSGGDSFDLGTGTVAGNAALHLIFGAGDDTFTLDSNSYSSLYADGGFGTNTFIGNVPLTPTSTLRNF